MADKDKAVLDAAGTATLDAATQSASLIVQEEVQRVKVVHGIAVPAHVAAGVIARAEELAPLLKTIAELQPEPPEPVQLPAEPAEPPVPEAGGEEASTLPAPEEEPVVSTEEEDDSEKKHSKRNRR